MPDRVDRSLANLLEAPRDSKDHALAARYAPVIRFNDREPFLPLAAGYTVFRETGDSPSFRQGRHIALVAPGQPPAALSIEYAIWWDWDIGHLYELEHAWVYVDERDQVVRCEASWHGGHHDMRWQGRIELEGDHPVLYSEPGKHAFAPTPAWFAERRARLPRSETSELAGMSGVLMATYLEGHVHPAPLHTTLVRTFLQQHAFEPAPSFGKRFAITADMLVPWPALEAWMPQRINHWLARLEREIPRPDYRFLRIGHRGARAHAPDNTIAGFRKAVELGADMVEIDVQRTADGEIVVVHDGSLSDAAGWHWPIGKSTLAQLKAIDLGGGERIPTLSQALLHCRDAGLGVYIEIKDGGAVRGVVDFLVEHELEKHFWVGSFRPDWLAEAKALAPQVVTSILFGSAELDPVKLAQSIGADYVHPCWGGRPNSSQLVTPQWMARVREAGLGVVIWNEERPSEIAALRQIGVDGVCSDAPELLR